MHINNVTIKNFRNFKDFAINFSQGFQTIIGENNIGKSNLYWAIRLVLDKDLSYNSKKMELKDFHGFKKNINFNDYILISIEFYDQDLQKFPNFHSFKINETNARITAIFAHKNKIKKPLDIKLESQNKQNNNILDDFSWFLYGGETDFDFENIINLSQISYRDLEGINLYYIDGFRNIKSDLHGTTKSLLTKYCQSRSDSTQELESIKSILKNSSNELNTLQFVPDISKNVENKNREVSGNYFSFPLSIGFISNYDVDAWNQVNLFFKPDSDINVPINLLGLGQKHILYLSLFISELENSSREFEINILLIEEPEAHLHPQLQKNLFSNLKDLKATQVFLSSHSTHIASDCDFKNLNIVFKSFSNIVKSFSPFNGDLLSYKEKSLLKRYLDATRSEMFFASAIIFVEGVAEQFIIPAIANNIYGLNIIEHNISIIPIHCRYFDPYLKIVQDGNLEIPVVVMIDGDSKEVKSGSDVTGSVKNAKKLEVKDRVFVSSGIETLESDLFPDSKTNKEYLKKCFYELGHEKSYDNFISETTKNTESWANELIKRIDKIIGKGRFAQELCLHIDEKFVVPEYIIKAIQHISNCKRIKIKNVE